jgi:hypothetical protein
MYLDTRYKIQLYLRYCPALFARLRIDSLVMVCGTADNCIRLVNVLLRRETAKKKVRVKSPRSSKREPYIWIHYHATNPSGHDRGRGTELLGK